MIEDYPSTMSDEEKEAHLLALYPPYAPPGRIHQPVEPKSQQESPPVTDEIAAPPIETDEQVALEPKRHPALANVYAWVTNPLSGLK